MLRPHQEGADGQDDRQTGRLTQVWRTSAETLRLGAVAGTPARMLLSVLLGLIALLCVSTVVGAVPTGLGVACGMPRTRSWC
ncbi:hypothetical protein ACFWIJ_35930 [Streptomyces sp. NPDC127079]|uniref:hypothetical protein n=1 Tax=Streptomyces sp. NPDC127079 TaxID=3347132 RepID=UPI00365A6E4D